MPRSTRRVVSDLIVRGATSTRGGRDVPLKQLPVDRIALSRRQHHVLPPLARARRRIFTVARKDQIERERRRRSKNVAAKPRNVARQTATRPKTESELFDGLRQGARNVAGVRWQMAVSVHLLVASFLDQLPFASLMPEGLEDLDARTPSGDRIYIQMKERGGGLGRFTAADLADALQHANPLPEVSRFLVLTDGELGSGLLDTGWSDTVADQPGQPPQDVRDHLVNAGLSTARAEELVAQTQLIRLPWNIRGETESLLVDSGVHPAVAGIVVGTLYDEYGSTSADQRGKTLATARDHTPADVERVVADVQSVVDLSGLDAAVAAGVCAPADYVHASAISPAQFYAGVDGSPAYVSAALDVVRVSEMARITSAVEQSRYALIVGPSGSGKSMLLWRAARDVIGGARIVRVRHLPGLAEADLLVRHVQLMRSSSTSRIVVAADDLGRPHMTAWGIAVDSLRELNDVFVIGACREEDFDASLLNRSAVLVRPKLDQDTATRIAERIASAGVATAMEPTEAWSRSDGLLMEYIALLTHAKRLEQVIADQAVDLRRPGRELERTAARLVTAAHGAGLSLTADQLRDALATTGASVDSLGDALDVLRGEHVVVFEGTTWRGLHELRSQALTDALHQSPPPTIVDTWQAVARLLTPAQASWLLRRVAEQRPDATAAVATVVASHAVDPGRGAADVAQLLEGAERADNAIYAGVVLPILEAASRTGTSARQLSTFVYGIRHQGLELPTTGTPLMDATFQHLTSVASSLPERASAILESVASLLTANDLRRLLANASLADAARLLEACVGVVPVDPDNAQQILAQLPPPITVAEAAMYGRVVEALATNFPETVTSVLGTTADRAATVLIIDPTIVGLDVTNEAAPEVTVTTMLPPHESPDPTPEWDAPAADTGGDHANRHAVAIARRVASACPEAAVVEIVTVTASGRRLVIAGSDDFEPGYKRMGREAFPARVNVRRNVGFQAAIGRRTAASTWTSLIAEQTRIVQELTDLVAEAPGRLRRHDKTSQRDQWTRRVKRVGERTQLLEAPPRALESQVTATHATVDAFERRDNPLSEGLRDIASHLSAILQGNLAGTAALLRRTCSRLRNADDNGQLVLDWGTNVATPTVDELLDTVERLAQVLLTVNNNPAAAENLDTRDLRATTDNIVEHATTAAADEQLTTLDTVLDGIPTVELHHVDDPDPFPNAIAPRAWLITVQIEHWNTVVEALRTLTHDQRMSLPANVIAAVAVDSEVQLPAVRIAHTGNIPEFPILADDLRPFAESANLHLHPSGNPIEQVTGIVDALTTLSWENSRRRARPEDWPDVPGTPTRTITELRLTARTVTEDLPAETRGMIREALEMLTVQVETELSQPATPYTLAAEMFENALADSHEGPAETLWDALATISAVSLLI